MKTVLVIGAGKSSSYLINYLLVYSRQYWRVIVMDSDANAIAEKIQGNPKGEAAVVDLHQEESRRALVKRSDLVISLLPANLHHIIAQDCIDFRKHLITASYVSPELMALNEKAKDLGLMFMCEMGLDPGIDHMSAMQIFNGIYKIAGEITSFRSSCGGLVAPESDDNPWHYKMTWNGKNIINAGKHGAKWLENEQICQVGYQELFKNYRKLKFPGLKQNFVAYPNRDSLKYQDLYELGEVKTFQRSTIRSIDFMKAWQVIVDAGLTNEEDSFDMLEVTYADWIAQKTGLENTPDLREQFQQQYQVDSKDMKMFDWIRVFENRPIYLEGTRSSAQILQDIFENRLQLNMMDLDMILMQNEVEYKRRGVDYKLISSMVVKGENKVFSAMSKTVGLPMALLAERIMTDKFDPSTIPGVQIPIMPEVYNPILRELAKNGVEFIEHVS